MNQIYLGVYNSRLKDFEDIQISEIVKVSDATIRTIAKLTNRISAAIIRKEISPSFTNLNEKIYKKWIDYKNQIEQSPIEKVNNTLDAKYIINKDNAIEVIHTAQELKDALPSEEPQFKR